MAEEDLTQISAGEFETVSQLLAADERLQIAFAILVIGINWNCNSLQEIFILDRLKEILLPKTTCFTVRT
jgi:hypothetical protein